MKKLIALAFTGLMSMCNNNIIPEVYLNEIMIIQPYENGILLGIDKDGDGVPDIAVDYEVIGICPTHFHVRYRNHNENKQTSHNTHITGR